MTYEICSEHRLTESHRVHRLGQTRPVFVDRLVITNTVEDRLLAIQGRKVGRAYFDFRSLLTQDYRKRLQMAASARELVLNWVVRIM